jgi:hypothetical protein
MPSALETQIQSEPVVVKPIAQKLAPTIKRSPFQPAPGFVPTSTQATGHFLKHTTDGGPAFVDITGGGSNVQSTPQLLTVTDLRDYQPRASLEVEGLEYVDFPSHLEEEYLMNPDKEFVKVKVEKDYWTECAELVKANTGAIQVHPYHWRHRMTPKNMKQDDASKGVSSKPVTHFHIDNDASTAEGSLRAKLGDEEAERWLQSGHWGIINVWKPIGDPAFQFPLAMVDVSGVDWEKDVEVVLTRNNYKNSINGLKYREDFDFYYVKDLRPDEALLFRNFDSKEGRSIGVPHAAVDDVNTPIDSPSRRSIEVRCLVLYAH